MTGVSLREKARIIPLLSPFTPDHALLFALAFPAPPSAPPLRIKCAFRLSFQLLHFL